MVTRTRATRLTFHPASLSSGPDNGTWLLRSRVPLFATDRVVAAWIGLASRQSVATEREKRPMTHNAKLVHRRFGGTGIIVALTAVVVLVVGGILLLVLT